ncbi:MAG: hypothetical protein SGJ27_13575 [Candidatus Melainabacteria bacterium]|nr:hypothetical protein [Candidatus Melainabacteria bacterium]
MSYKSGTLSPLQNSNIHRLEGKVFWRWWQATGFISSPFRNPIKQKKEELADNYNNPAIQAQLIFLLQLPFTIGIMLYSVGPDGIKLALAVGFLGVLAFVNLMLTFRQHCKYVIEVQEEPSGLVMKSPLGTRTVRWAEIADFFPVDNGDYLLLSANHGDFLLSSDLTESSTLFERISANAPKHSEEYTINYRLPNCFLDSQATACWAITVATLFTFVSHLIYPEKHLSAPITEFIVALILIPIVVAIWRSTFTNFAELVRYGNHSYSIRTRNGTISTIPLDGIKKVNRLGAFYLIETRTAGWFLVLADKKEALSAKLIETKQFRLSQS